MKTKSIPVLIVLGVTAGVISCNHSESDSSMSTNVNVAAREMKKEVKEAAEATKNYVGQTKDQFVASMQDKLSKLDEKMAELGAKAQNLKDDAKVQSDKALASLKEERDKVGQKLEEVKKASQDTWQDIKAGFESAYADLEKAYENAKAKFSN
jgi:hypothetical protein